MFMATLPLRDPENDPLPAELRAIVELFNGELAKVSFPDVDAAVLQREVDEVTARAREVARARQALVGAESALSERTALLAQLAARGLAYARIYAEAHPARTDLARKLEVAVARPPETNPEPGPRRRGRPPKTPRVELPFDRAGTGEQPAETAP